MERRITKLAMPTDQKALLIAKIEKVYEMAISQNDTETAGHMVELLVSLQ